jgi:NADPH oxidase
MTKSAMNGSEKDEKATGFRGDYVELDSSTTGAMPVVRIDGPYGAPAEDVFDVEVAVLIGAGIGAFQIPRSACSNSRTGVTPFASILKDIWYRQRKGNLGTLRRVEFFWVCRDAPSFGWFQSLLSEVEASQADREESRPIYPPLN